MAAAIGDDNVRGETMKRQRQRRKLIDVAEVGDTLALLD